MIEQPNDATGDAGISVVTANLPSWFDDFNNKWSFAVWHYRKAEAGAGNFRGVFQFYNNNSNYCSIRQSKTTMSGTLRVAGTSYNLTRDTADATTLPHMSMADADGPRWCLTAGYFDPTQTNVRMRVWGLNETSTDASAADMSMELKAGNQPLSSSLTSTGALRIGRALAELGVTCWYGVLGGLVIWKDVEIDADDVQAIWDSKNPAPWSLPASGNLPGPAHDGILAVPLCPSSNPKARGGSNTTGKLMGDTLTEEKDYLVYRRETGVTNDGTISTYESGQFMPTQDVAYRYFNPLRQNPS